MVMLSSRACRPLRLLGLLVRPAPPATGRYETAASLCALNRVTNVKPPGVVQVLRHYPRTPLERMTMDQLKGAVSGGRGGRGGRGRKKGGKKGMRDTQDIFVGRGVGGVRWPGLSYPLTPTKYSVDWLKEYQLGIQRVDTDDTDSTKSWSEGKDEFIIRPRQLEGKKRQERRVSEMDWDRRGWTGTQWGGRHVGCPELSNGTPLQDFKSVVIKVKRVANQTKGGKKRTLSALVVVGNGNGMAGFAVGRGDDLKPAIRKAKNKAVHYLQFVPRCDGHTIFHNVKVKFCKTNIEMERKVKGHGLRCHRIVSAICQLVGIENIRCKVTGSNNPLNTVRAAFKGLTSQETFQELAERTGQFVVERRRESLYRPLVVGVPSQEEDEECRSMLEELQLIPRSQTLTSDTSTNSVGVVNEQKQSNVL